MARFQSHPLAIKAKEARIRSEDRGPRPYSAALPIIEADSIRRAHRVLSEQPVEETLLTEAAELAPAIERFRHGKAGHNESSLANLLGVSESGVRSAVRPLLEVGFLEEIGASGSFKIPIERGSRRRRHRAALVYRRFWAARSVMWAS